MAEEPQMLTNRIAVRLAAQACSIICLTDTVRRPSGLGVAVVLAADTRSRVDAEGRLVLDAVPDLFVDGRRCDAVPAVAEQE